MVLFFLIYFLFSTNLYRIFRIHMFMIGMLSKYNVSYFMVFLSHDSIYWVWWHRSFWEDFHSCSYTIKIIIFIILFSYLIYMYFFLIFLLKNKYLRDLLPSPQFILNEIYILNIETCTAHFHQFIRSQITHKVIIRNSHTWWRSCNNILIL